MSYKLSLSAMPAPIFTLSVMVSGEIAGLYYYWAKDWFLQFLLLSILATAAMSALLWREFFRQFGVTPNVVAWFLFLLMPKSRLSFKGNRAENAIDIAFDALLLVFAGLWVLASRKANNKPARQNESSRTSPSDSTDLGPLGCLVIATMSLFDEADMIFFGDHSLFWLVPALPPFGWFLWHYILHRKQQKQLNPTESLSLLQ